jgi:tetratricopeptide (TPR) repeat protein
MSVSAIALIAIFSIVSISNVRLQKQRDIAEGHREESERQRDIAEGHREESERQRERAITHLKEAREAVDRLLTRVGYDRLVATPFMETVRLDLLRDALEFYRGFVQQENDDPDLRFETGRAWRRLGKIQDELRDWNDAEQSFRAALRIQTELFAEFPTNAAIRQELAASENNLGSLLGQKNDASEESGQAIQQALEMQEKLVAEFPHSPAYRRELGESYDALGRFLNGKKQFKEAEKALRHAVELLEATVAADPRDQKSELSLATRRRNFGVFLARQNRAKEAEAVFRNDLQFWQSREAENPTDPRLAGRTADAFKHLGTLLINLGNFAEGQALLHAAIDRLQRLADEYPKVFGNHELLAAALEKLARAHRNRNEFSLARPLLERAVAHLQICQNLKGLTVDQRILLGSLLWLLADTQIQLGAYQTAAANAEKLHTVCVDRWEECYQAARLFTRCMPFAEHDQQLSENARQSDADHFGRRSVEMLREAFRLGYKDLAFVKKDPGLDVLRSRDDFKQLLKEQAAK